MTIPSAYRIRVDGHLDDHWSDRLAGLTLTREPDGTTTLVGHVDDQTQLHGVLAGLRDIGATLLSVTSLDVTPGEIRDASDAPRP